jgi:hypothetical protein
MVTIIIFCQGVVGENEEKEDYDWSHQSDLYEKYSLHSWATTKIFAKIKLAEGIFKYCEQHDIYHSTMAFSECPCCYQDRFGSPHVRPIMYNYTTKAPVILGFKEQPKLKYAGVEIEYEISKSVEFGSLLHQVYTILSGHVICKRDGSLVNGLEIVSKPDTFSMHFEKFKKFFDEASLPYFLAKDNTGMHIHVSNRDIGWLQLGKLLHFMRSPSNTDFLRLIGERESRYARLGTGENITDFFKGNTKDRYNAVNTQNESTLEFRIFASPKTYEAFRKNMEFCDAVTVWTAPANSSIKALSSGAFIKFVNENKGMFPFLNKFIKEKC